MSALADRIKIARNASAIDIQLSVQVPCATAPASPASSSYSAPAHRYARPTLTHGAS